MKNSKYIGKYLLRRLGITAVLIIGIASIVGSGGGDTGYEGDDSSGSSVWVSIRSPDYGTVFETSTGSISGWASCPECPPSEGAYGGCPPISCPSTTSVSVSWLNQTTGVSGAANQSIIKSCSCLLSACASSCIHQWSAPVPLEMGPNNIVVTASSPDGGSDSDSTMISRLPPPPDNVAAIAGHNEITVSWSNVPIATSYNLYWSTIPITKDTANQIIGVTSPYKVEGLSDNVTYYFAVTAVIGEYESYASDVVWATAGWFTENVAETLDTTEWRDTSIAVDSTGNAHVHYSYDEHIEPSTLLIHNYYTTKETGTWNSVFVDRTSYVNANIALDKTDTVHISFTDFPGLTHSIYSSGAWTPTLVDAQADYTSSLALDSADKVHAAYTASTDLGQELRYINNKSGSWEPSTVDENSTGRRVYLAIDATGAAHMAYLGDYPDYGLMYATNKDGGWSISTVDQGYIENVSLAVDMDEKVHIVYSDNISQLRYTHNTSGTWHVELLDDDGSPSHPSIVIDSNGRAHISYYDNGDRELHYATNPSGIWQIIPIDTVAFVFPNNVGDTAIARDTQDKVHISYFDDGTLKYASNK